MTTSFWNGPTTSTALITAMSTMAATGVPQRLLTREMPLGKSPSCAIANSGRAPDAR